MRATPGNDTTEFPSQLPPKQFSTDYSEENFTELKDLGCLQRILAPVTSSDLFKSDFLLRKPKSTIDVARFLSYEAQLRSPSSLKAGSAGLSHDVISLSTGRPSPNTYPLNRIDFSASNSELLSQNKKWSQKASNSADDSPKSSRNCTVTRRDPESSIDLSIALSYGYSLGSEQLIQFLTTHVSHIHAPQFSDWEICLSIGSTSALEIAFRNFVNAGEFVLVEEFTYSGTIEAAKPLGIKLLPVCMDSNGLCPTSLETILSSWPKYFPGKPKPKVLYTIPTGQNPTGITQPLERRQQILEIAEIHDLLIIEDDPYYYLSFVKDDGLSKSSFVPSYLSLSKSGRVLRLDSTSKILAPGLRLGWITAPKAIVETFQASHDFGIVHPSGLSQVIVYKLLSEAWGHGGFAQWLQNLADLYRRKAAVITTAMERILKQPNFPCNCSWTDVQAGMFIWLRIDCGRYPAIAADTTATEKQQTLSKIEDIIYKKALTHGVLCCKGSFFKVMLPKEALPPTAKDNAILREKPEPIDLSVHFRLTFATEDDTMLIHGIERLSVALWETFGVPR